MVPKDFILKMGSRVDLVRGHSLPTNDLDDSSKRVPSVRGTYFSNDHPPGPASATFMITS